MFASVDGERDRTSRCSKLFTTGRYALANILLLLGAASFVAGGWTPFIVILVILVFGSFADELSGEERSRLGPWGRLFYDANLYLALPLMTLLAVLLAVYAHHHNFHDQRAQTIGVVLAAGYLFALVGATVGHEFSHRQDRLSQLIANALLGFTLNPSFVVFHVHVHHRYVGGYDEASTARRGEPMFFFLFRAITRQYTHAAEVEAARLRRRRLPVWSIHNRFIQAHAAPLIILLAMGLIGGPFAILLFVIAAIIGRSFHEMINYVQHYGLVRVENTPIQPRHSWDCYHRLSTVLHYNLPRHADHHLFATKPFWNLDSSNDAPLLPFGYQTMATLTLIPPVFEYFMKPLLADWDERFASEEEREIIRARGWE